MEDLIDLPIEADLNTWYELLILYTPRVISAIIVLIAGYIIGGSAQKTIHKIKKLDPTLKSFLGGLVKYVILAVAIVTVLGQFGVETASLIAVLGAAGLAIGLALQGTLSNVAAGVMLLILRPFNVGDYIDAGGIGGTIKQLGLFGCEMATADNVYIFVPNSSIWNNEIFNYSRNLQRRQDISVGIAYDEDIDKAFKAILKVLDADERLIRTEEKKPQVMVNTMGDSSVDLIVRVWSLSSEYWQVKWDLTKEVKESLDKAGITIPFPTRTIEIVKDNDDTPPKKKTPRKKTEKK